MAIFVWLTGKWSNPFTLSPKTWGFLLLSTLATGVSWVCYFRAFQLGEAAKVAPIDKLSVVLVAILAFIFLSERPSLHEWFSIALVSIGVVVIVLKA
ncbi:MAG: EamA family transporter [Chloroflexus sp.]|nr:EamA family transporter [Chloroflexus sp.]MDW8402976.1 EamA family transporter [Chloroflexus sp.]